MEGRCTKRDRRGCSDVKERLARKSLRASYVPPTLEGRHIELEMENARRGRLFEFCNFYQSLFIKILKPLYLEPEQS